MRVVVEETSLRYHVEGTDALNPEEDDWVFLGAAALLNLPGAKQETASEIAARYKGHHRTVRIVDTRA